MKTSVEPLEGNKVKVSVEVPETEFEPEIDAAFRRLSREVRIPGFRPGKAPRRILEARLGTEAARDEALRHAVPEYYAKAVREGDVDVIAPPELEITGGADGGAVQFDAVVEVRPVITVGGYDSLRITVPAPDPTDEDIDHQIDHLREQYATLETVERAAADDDTVVIDISGTQEGEPVAGLTAEDYSYRVGAGAPVPELDEHLRGASAGDELSFSAEHPDPEQAAVDIEVTVKEVKEKVLPDADDAWAAEASEFETLEELRADLAKRQKVVRRIQGQMAIREKTGEALAGLVSDEIPEAMLTNEMQQRLQDLAMRLQAQGMGLDQYLMASGIDAEQLQADLRETAEHAVKVDLALRAVVAADNVEVSDEELDEELEAVAQRVGAPLETVREQLDEAGQLTEVRIDIAKRKALDKLIEGVEIVDEEGNALDRASFELEQDDDEEDDDEGEADGDAADESSVASEADPGSVVDADPEAAPKGDE